MKATEFKFPPIFHKEAQMAARHIFYTAFSAFAFVTGAAMAHGNAHESKQAYDPATVEETAFGHAGNPRKVARTIKVGMSDAMRFTPGNIKIKTGQTVRFVISNGGQTLHEMVIGTTEELKSHAELMRRFPEMEHAAAHMVHVKPGQSGEIVWQFTQPGEYSFACLLPGHFEAGMVGTVVVQ